MLTSQLVHLKVSLVLLPMALCLSCAVPPVPPPASPQAPVDAYRAFTRESNLSSLRQLTRDPSDELATAASETYGILLQSNRLTWQDPPKAAMHQLFLIDASDTPRYRQLTFNMASAMLGSFFGDAEPIAAGSLSEVSKVAPKEAVVAPSAMATPSDQPPPSDDKAIEVIYSADRPLTRERYYYRINTHQGPAATWLFKSGGALISCPASVSADGTKLLYENEGEVWIFNRTDQSHTNLGEGSCPTWFSGETDILYNQLLYTKEGVGRFFALWTMKADGTMRQELAAPSQGVSYERATVSPDGQFIAFEAWVLETETTGSYDIWLIDLKERRLIQLTTHPADDVYPIWYTDSDIVFSSRRAGKPSSEEWNVWLAKIPR